jgi:hypothetical protein
VVQAKDPLRCSMKDRMLVKEEKILNQARQVRTRYLSFHREGAKAGAALIAGTGDGFDWKRIPLVFLSGQSR